MILESLLPRGDAADLAAKADALERGSADDAVALVEAGCLRLAAAQPRLALKGFDRAALLAPEMVDAHEGSAVALRQLGRADDAGLALETAARLGPKDAGVRTNQGILSLRRNLADQAEKQLHEALALDSDCADAYANLCWILRRKGQLAEAVAMGQRAVAARPHDTGFNYLIFAQLAADDGPGALDSSRAGLAFNPHSISAMAYMVSALNASGQAAEGRTLADFERLILARTLPLPAGFETIKAFNAALSEHALKAPSRPFDPTQSHDLLASPRGAAKGLHPVLNKAVAEYLNALPRDASHPYLRTRPTAWRMDGWATRVSKYGHVDHHYHQHGWVSGVFYVRVPPSINASQKLDGCIEFCRFRQYGETPVNSELAVFRPEEGLLLIFPSYLFHRVLAFQSDQMRISFAFNVMPTRFDS